MKKIAYATLITLGLGASFTASAAGITNNFTGAQITTLNDATGCQLLSENVNINTSNNVSGAYHCDDLTNTIFVSTCHNGSSAKTRTVLCQSCGTAQGTKLFNDAACDTAGTEKWTFAAATSYNAYVGSSAGGSVAQIESTSVCNDAKAVTITNGVLGAYTAATSIAAGGL